MLWFEPWKCFLLYKPSFVAYRWPITARAWQKYQCLPWETIQEKMGHTVHLYHFYYADNSYPKLSECSKVTKKSCRTSLACSNIWYSWVVRQGYLWWTYWMVWWKCKKFKAASFQRRIKKYYRASRRNKKCSSAHSKTWLECCILKNWAKCEIIFQEDVNLFRMKFKIT